MGNHPWFFMAKVKIMQTKHYKTHSKIRLNSQCVFIDLSIFWRILIAYCFPNSHSKSQGMKKLLNGVKIFCDLVCGLLRLQ